MKGSGGSFKRSLFFGALLACLVLGAWPADGRAAEMVLQNDSIASPGAGTPLPNFLPNEIVTSWLTTPVAGDIVGVQILWDSVIGANADSTETAIHIYAAGTFPTPGTTLASIGGTNGVTLKDHMLNEFRFTDPPTNSSALSVPVSAGQTFVVGLEFLNQSSGNAFASSIEVDGALQTGKNSIYLNPPNGTWTSGTDVSLPGDFGIRAILRPVPEPATMALLLMGIGLPLCYAQRHKASG
jgi:hypothetical protein